MVILSGGTSKSEGDVSHRIIAQLGKPGIVAHGVALKPGKPLCLAVCDGTRWWCCRAFRPRRCLPSTT